MKKVFKIGACIAICFLICMQFVQADVMTSNGINKKIIYNNTKNITTSGDKPTTPSSNCKDVESTYWNKTTSISGDGSLDSVSSIGSMLYSSSSGVIIEMVNKAIAMAEKGGITYSQDGRQLVDTKEKLDTMTATDCSGLVYSLYKSYLGINIGTTTYDMYDKVVAKTDYGNGWTGAIASYDQDTSVLQPGDILLRKGTGRAEHVAIYVGNGKLVDHGSGIGPKLKDVPNGGDGRYTYYIRFRNVNVDASSFSAKYMPSGKEAIDQVLDSMNDIEIMARIIYGEQGGQSFESQVLVGITILNRGEIKTVAKSKYENGRYYEYNCIEDANFWKAIPQDTINAAYKAIQAKESGTYKVVDIKSNKSVEAINVYGFKANESKSFDATWNGWKLQLVLKNTWNYTGFYVI